MLARTGLKAHLVRGAVGTLLVRGSLLGLNVLIGIVLARWLGPSSYGAYELAIATITLLSLPCSIGIPTVMLRETAAAGSRGDAATLSGILIWGVVSVTLLSALVVALAAAALHVLPAWSAKLDPGAFRWALCALPLLSILAVGGQYLRGLHRTLRGQSPELLRQALFFVLVSIAAVGGLAAPTARNAVILYVAALCCGLASLGAFLRGRLPAVRSWRTARSERSRWLRMALPFAIIGGIHLINSRADIIMLGTMTDAATVGAYAIAIRAAELLLFVPIALNVSMASALSHLHAADDGPRLRQAVSSAVRLQSACAIPILVALLLFGRQIIELAFGPEYGAAAGPLRVLLIGHMVNVLTGPADLLLNMTGRERATALGMAVAAAVNVSLNLLLIPHLGMIGAALATTASNVTWNVGLAVLAGRALGVNTTVLPFAARAA